MNTLDEVIYHLENCAYAPLTDDALHYLKELRHILDNTVWVGSTKEEKGYWKLPTLTETGNDPLTWDELRTMEGKPVWIETDNVKFWTVIDNFRTICEQECLCCSKGYMMCKSTYTRGDWQAYRKERNGKA